MKILLLLASLLTQPACVLAPESAMQDPGRAQAVEAVFVHRGATDFQDVDPVQARSASFGKTVAVVDAFPWQDRLVETLPVAVSAPVAAHASAVVLSVDIVDSDPLAARGWR